MLSNKNRQGHHNYFSNNLRWDDDAFAAFEAALDAPVPNNAKLKAQLASTPPWE